MFTNTLSKEALESLALLGKGNVLPTSTYLAGGSALALHFGHRISVDFDFFTPLEFSSEDLVKKLEVTGEFIPQLVKKGTVLGLFNNVRFSVFYYAYPLLYSTYELSLVSIADPKDIGAMKIAAIMDRGTKKDFIDLFILNKNGISTETCFEIYDKKYKALANNIYSIITSLSYFVDAENSEMPKMIEEVNWEEIKTFFEKEAVRLGKKYLG